MRIETFQLLHGHAVGVADAKISGISLANIFDAASR